MTSTIQDDAIIGDGRSCALVAKTGSIDYLCWPRFDGDACLAALLGDERHGYWLISPAGYVSETMRSYREDTMILETEHVTDTGRVQVTDLMPWHGGGSAIIRIVEGLEGEVQMTMSLRLRFGYGQITPWRQPRERGLIFEVGPDRVVLDCPIELTMDTDDTSARFMLAKGAKIAFVLAYSPSMFTLTALLDAGYHKEAARWRDWILRAVAGQPAAMQIVYRIDGRCRLSGREFDGLAGGQGATPVRIGNAASGQTQLDVFGELMDSFDVLAKAGIERTPRIVEVETAIVEHLEKVWDQPSADIWESRGNRQCYSYSQVTAWLGVTRFVAAGVSNDVGLLSEEYDARSRSLTGNIPQALTHLGLINTALFLSGPVIQRAGG